MDEKYLHRKLEDLQHPCKELNWVVNFYSPRTGEKESCTCLQSYSLVEWECTDNR